MKLCINCSNGFEKPNWQCPFCNNLPDTIDGYLAFSPDLAASNISFNDVYFEQLVGVEENNFWFSSRNKLIIWALHKYFPKVKSFCEIGCGTGIVLSSIEKTFPSIRLHGGEISTLGLDYAARRVPRAEFYQMDARKIPFVNEFDVIGSFDVLEHIQDDEKVLKQMYQAVCLDGGIILTVPQHPFLWSQRDKYGYHVRRYRARELKAKVEYAGFEVAKMTSFVTILLPLMVLARLKEKRSSKEFDPLREFKISNVTNALFQKMLDLERELINLGLSLPAGGSLLLIAYKSYDGLS
jgi:SAM-dependent methyltransferase